ncbi:MAG: hypothetical protein ACYTHN_15400, partial [Planctomycetota bacterium]
KTFLLGLGAGEKGEVLIATGHSGRVFAVDRDRHVTTVVDLEEEQVLGLAMNGAFPVAVGTGAPGILYTVKTPHGGKGRYISKIYDAKFPAKWGRVSWKGKGTFTLSFRTGHTEKPDRTWTPWSPPLHSPDQPLPAPPGRYLQYRIDFDGDPSAAVTRVRIAFVVQNQRPEVKELKVGPGPGKETFPLFHEKKETVLKIQAKAQDPNGDRLLFRFFFRREGEEGWIPMTEDPLDKPEYSWSIQDLPDGLYEVRVVASDERSNPVPLRGEKISRPIPIDNHRPLIEGLTVEEGNVPKASGAATDGGSVITRVEYRVDGGSWLPLAPSDGVLDSRREAFAFPLPGLSVGLHRLWVRAFDRAGNTGVAMVEFRVR